MWYVGDWTYSSRRYMTDILLFTTQPSAQELVERIGREAEDHINRMANLTAKSASSQQSREARL